YESICRDSCLASYRKPNGPHCRILESRQLIFGYPRESLLLCERDGGNVIGGFIGLFGTEEAV
ncbi:MAG: hypothetical protein UIJ82_09130, partial [Collinsella sp.]|nr:hypothetical protein [Collinsella sp.]